MARKPTILQNEYPYGITVRSNNKEWFQIPMNICWSIFEKEIQKTTRRYGIQTHAFVLMSNHFHWLVSTPESNLSAAMRFFLTETSRKLARASGRINKIYGARYKWTLIQDPYYYANTIRYFYQNPTRAGVCRFVEDYPWSDRFQNSKVPTSPCTQMETEIPQEPFDFRLWLNTIPDGIHNEMMRKALRRTEFRFPPHPTQKRYF